jgi:asparagine synthase (glutamine-hydrolysing)
MAHDLLLSPTFFNRGIFQRSSIEEMLHEHQTRKTDHGKRIWTLVMLELWFREYLDKA